MGVGSIPISVLCAGGLLLFAILVMAKSYLFETSEGERFTMNTAQKKSTHINRLWHAFLYTTAAVGAEAVSGLALLG